MGRLLEPSPANIRAWDGVGQTDPEGTVMGRRGTEVPARSSAALVMGHTSRPCIAPLPPLLKLQSTLNDSLTPKNFKFLHFYTYIMFI